jgi:hypothetical protein
MIRSLLAMGPMRGFCGDQFRTVMHGQALTAMDATGASRGDERSEESTADRRT